MFGIFYCIIVEQRQLTGILVKNLFSQNIRIPKWVRITLESTRRVQDYWQRKEDDKISVTISVFPVVSFRCCFSMYFTSLILLQSAVYVYIYASWVRTSKESAASRCRGFSPLELRVITALYFKGNSLLITLMSAGFCYSH